LADLRVSQGRLEEAEILLEGHEDQGEAILPLARLHLLRGETDLARATLEQALGSEETRGLHHAPLLMLLCETMLRLDKAEAAQQAAQSLRNIAAHSQSELLMAQADLVEGKVLAHQGQAEAATKFQAVIGRLKAYDQSLLASRARLELARLVSKEDRAGAITWARAALAAFERMGATQDTAEATHLLQQLGAGARLGQRPYAQLTEREAEVLALLAQGLTNREIGEKLVISAKTVEHHVSQVLGKLGARSRAEAAALAVKAGGQAK
jgi:DNA-binding NarL/FixJ family response regulator